MSIHNYDDEYCLMRYEPDFEYYTYPARFQYAWIRETDGDYFGLHYVDEIELNPGWDNEWEDGENKPSILPIYGPKGDTK